MSQLRVKRKGYTTKAGAKVAPATFLIRDRGAPGRGKKLFSAREGDLVRFGYSTAKGALARHRALVPAVRAYGALSTFQKLNNLVLWNKRTNPSVSQIARADRNWVKKVYMEKR